MTSQNQSHCEEITSPRPKDPASAAKYVIITPAYNEEKFIGKTIDSVLSQTYLPHKWIIVDDGSTDATIQVIRQRTQGCAFVQCYSRDRDPSAEYYKSNVHAIQYGYSKVADSDFDYLAVLDADIVLEKDYYAKVLSFLACNPTLGIATGIYLEQNGQGWKEVAIDRRSTPKALQVFRRACFEAIGGYRPLPNGGEDTCAEIMARMKGWQTWSFPEARALHLRPVGMGAARSVLASRFRQGFVDYCLGWSPLFEAVKCARRLIVERPVFFSGAARLAGFFWGAVRRAEKQISDDMLRYVRREQMHRLAARAGLRPTLWKPTMPQNGRCADV